VPGTLSYDLHKLTSRLDRAADGLLRREAGVSYSRFLALFAVRESGGTQRDLARWLGLTEPSASRMVGVLADEGLLTVTTTAGAGNRRQLRLTADGASLVDRCGRLLEGRFEDLVRSSGVSYQEYHRQTRLLLGQLDASQQTAYQQTAHQQTEPEPQGAA
jgi:DNA-binding MarR family transcriptional regulator